MRDFGLINKIFAISFGFRKPIVNMTLVANLYIMGPENIATLFGNTGPKRQIWGQLAFSSLSITLI